MVNVPFFPIFPAHSFFELIFDILIGGGIDDCGVAAGFANACSPPAPSPDSAGTIMSYCHLSVQAIILEFHDIVVSQALIPGLLNASCVTICNSDTNSTLIEENINEGRRILKVIDLLGRESKEIKNQPLFYIYDDGTVEKKIIIE